MTFDPAWEAEHARRQWGTIANHHLARFVARTYPGHEMVRFLDVGAGAGAQTLWLAQRGNVLAFDGSDAALRRIAKAAGWSSRVFFEHSEITKFGDECDGIFDCVVDVASLQCVPDDDAAAFIGRMRKALAPGGTFFSFTDAGSDPKLHTIGKVYPRTHKMVRAMFGGYTCKIGQETVDRPDGTSTRHWIIEARVIK